MTQKEITEKLKELREERNRINNESAEIFAKTRPIQAEIDRLEMLAMGFDYETFGKEPKYVRYKTNVDSEPITYLGYITEVKRRSNSVTLCGKIVEYQQYEDGVQYFRVMDCDEFEIYKGSVNQLEIITKEEFDLQSHLFASKALKINEGNVDFVHEYMITKEKAFEAFNKILGGFIDTSFDMSKPWEDIFKSYLED